MTAAQGLAVLRIAFGLYIVLQVVEKTRTGWLTSGALMTGFIRQIGGGAEAFYRPFLDSVVLPNAGFFSQLVVIGEWVAGVLLVLGLFTRVGAIVGLWLMVNYLLLRGMFNLAGIVNWLFIVAMITFILTPAGHSWGLDRIVSRSKSRAVRWAASGK